MGGQGLYFCEHPSVWEVIASSTRLSRTHKVRTLTTRTVIIPILETIMRVVIRAIVVIRSPVTSRFGRTLNLNPGLQDTSLEHWSHHWDWKHRDPKDHMSYSPSSFKGGLYRVWGFNVCGLGSKLLGGLI